MKHILLVEPDKKIANIIKEFFEREEGLSIQLAHNAQDGIFAADDQRPDLVLLELAIPLHNGFAFLHEFRSYSDWANVPVIVHSHLAEDEPSMSNSWKMLGAVKYFYKPTTSLGKLKTAVNEVLGV